jgi:hypothetical protein
MHAGEVGDFTTETAQLFLEVDANTEPLLAALARRGIAATMEGGGISIEGSDARVHDEVRDALVEAEAPLRRMAPRRHALTELFEREGE